MQNSQTEDNIYNNVLYAFSSDWIGKQFESVLNTKLPNYKKYKRSSIKSQGKFPVIDQGEVFISGYIDDEDGLYKGELPIIIFGDHTRNIKYVDFAFAVGADGTKILKPKGDLDSKFFYYYLKSVFIPPSGYSRHYKYLREIEVPVPELDIQHQIVNKIDSQLPRITETQEKVSKAKMLIQKFRQSVLSAAISGRLTEDWRENQKDIVSAGNLFEGIKIKVSSQNLSQAQKKRLERVYSYQEINDSSELPEEWQYVSLDKLCLSCDYGTSAKSQREGKIPVLRMGNLQNGEIDWDDLVYTSDEKEIKKYELKPNTVLFNRTNSPELVGKTSIYRGEKPTIFAGYLIRINNYPELNPEYLNYCLNSLYAREYCNQVKSDGVSQSNINAQKLGKFEVPLCSLEEQEEIVKRIKTFFTIADQVEKQIEKAESNVDKLTHSILAKAFRGEL